MSRLLTIADLAERWACSAGTVMDRVRDRGVPFVWLGREASPNLHARGQKAIRFRPEAIESWERSQERACDEPKAVAPASRPRPRRGRDSGSREAPPAVPMSPFLAAQGWDGIDRG